MSATANREVTLPPAGPNPRRVAAGRLNRAKCQGLTEAGRQRLREAALANRPWQFSTGPRTAAGKALRGRDRPAPGKPGLCRPANSRRTRRPERPGAGHARRPAEPPPGAGSAAGAGAAGGVRERRARPPGAGRPCPAAAGGGHGHPPARRRRRDGLVLCPGHHRPSAGVAAGDHRALRPFWRRAGPAKAGTAPPPAPRYASVPPVHRRRTHHDLPGAIPR